MLFIIQNSQTRHTIAIQLKLDEIIRATKGAHNEMMDIEKLTDEDMVMDGPSGRNRDKKNTISKRRTNK